MKRKHRKKRHKRDSYHSNFPVDLIGSLVAIAVLVYIFIRFVLPF